MKRLLLTNKNKITLISAILIVIAFVSRLAFGLDIIFNIGLIIASVLGVAPIAIQAFQALRVKVVSIYSWDLKSCLFLFSKS